MKVVSWWCGFGGQPPPTTHRYMEVQLRGLYIRHFSHPSFWGSKVGKGMFEATCSFHGSFWAAVEISHTLLYIEAQLNEKIHSRWVVGRPREATWILLDARRVSWVHARKVGSSRPRRSRPNKQPVQIKRQRKTDTDGMVVLLCRRSDSSWTRWAAAAPRRWRRSPSWRRWLPGGGPGGWVRSASPGTVARTRLWWGFRREAPRCGPSAHSWACPSWARTGPPSRLACLLLLEVLRTRRRLHS